MQWAPKTDRTWFDIEAWPFANCGDLGHILIFSLRDSLSVKSRENNKTFSQGFCED